MKFEEALSAVREGKKIRHPIMPEDEYLMGCYISIGKEFMGPLDPEYFEKIKTRHISIVKMKGEKQHIHMQPNNWPIKQPCCDPDLHSMPQLNLLSIMADDWEILE